MEFVGAQRRLDDKQQVALLSHSTSGQKNLKTEDVCAQKASPICINSVSISSVSSPSSPHPSLLSSTASVSLCWCSRVYLTSFVSTSHSLCLCSVQLLPPPPHPTHLHPPLHPFFYFSPPVYSLRWQGFCPLLVDTLWRPCELASLGCAGSRCYDNTDVG